MHVLFSVFCPLLFAGGLSPDCDLAFIQVSGTVQEGVFHRSREYLLRETNIDGKPYHEAVVVTDFNSNTDFVTTVIRREVRSGLGPFDLSEKSSGVKDAKRPITDIQEEMGMPQREIGRSRIFSPGKPRIIENSGFAKKRERVSVEQSVGEHYSLVKELVEKNLDSYRRRRKNWSEEMIQHLADAAVDYLNDSVYVVVRNKNTGQVVGGVRFILSPYGIKDGKVVAEGPTVEKYYGPVKGFREKGEVIGPQGLPRPPEFLPEETELGITLDRPVVEGKKGEIHGGLKVEMGTLFVDKKLSPEDHNIVWGEVWMQTLRFAKQGTDPEMNYYGTTIHAYADVKSRKLYLPLGFELLRQYEHNGKKVSYKENEEPAPIIKEDGSPWWPIVYHTEKIEQFFSDWVEGLYPNKNHSHVHKRLRQLAEDGAPISVSLEQVQVLLRSLEAEDEKIADGAFKAIERIINQQRFQLDQFWDPTTDIPKSIRAERAVANMDRVVFELLARIPGTIHKLPPERMDRLISLAKGLAEVSEGHMFVPSNQRMRRHVIPFLADRSWGARLRSARDLKHTFPTSLDAFNAIIQSGKMSALPRSQLLDMLKARGLPEKKIQSAGKVIHELLEYKSTNYEDIESEAVGLAWEMETWAGTDPQVIRTLLLYATHPDQ